MTTDRTEERCAREQAIHEWEVAERCFHCGITRARRTPAPVQQIDIPKACERIVQRVCELPDRSSPEEWPEAMLVTPEELTWVIAEEIERQTKGQS